MTTPRLAARNMTPMFPGFAGLRCRRYLAGKDIKQHGSHRYAREWKWAAVVVWRWIDCSWCGLPLAERRHSIMAPRCHQCAANTLERRR